MLVGTTNINYKELKTFANNPQDLVYYVDNLVPIWARHIKGITDNQRYFVAIHLRDVLSLPYKTRMSMVDVLVKDITLTGVMSGFTSITDIVDACDKDSLIHMIERKLGYEE